MKVTVIDSIMGSGKTTSLINMMNENLDERFIYITPYRDEIQRVIEGCYNRYFETPKNFDKINLKPSNCNGFRLKLFKRKTY